MFRISTVAYAILFFLTSHFFHEVIQTTLPEATTIGMTTVIIVHILTSWSYLTYAFNSFYTSIDKTFFDSDTFNKALTLALFLLCAATLLVLTYNMSAATVNFPELTYSACIALIVIVNYRTTIYKEYQALNARRQSTGLKPI